VGQFTVDDDADDEPGDVLLAHFFVDDRIDLGERGLQLLSSLGIRERVLRLGKRERLLNRR